MLPSTLAAVNLRQTVLDRARVEGDLLKVDDFLNHRVEPSVIAEVATAFADKFAPLDPELILTAEASGIPPSVATGLEMSLPVVYAKKYLGPGDRYSYTREVQSPTKGTEYRVEVARRALDAGKRVVIIDDFLAGGRTAEALGRIAEEAGCEVIAFGFVLEKTFTGGRQRLESNGWRVESLVMVDDIGLGTFDLRAAQ